MKLTGESKFLAVFLLLAGVAAVLWAAVHYAGAPIHPHILAAARWIALLAFCGYAYMRRSLTTWIAAGILIGTEIGHDWPQTAANLQVLSSIFLRMIRTIVAPLIFSTLVVGIAGHSNLKQVGRMGIKPLIYFEIVTTIALFIGLGAINLSKAGVGIKAPANVAAPRAQLKKPTTTDLILHVFPENIAKSVAENEVLQVVVFSIIFGIALAQVQEKKRRPVLDFMEGFSETMFKFTNIVMLFAPVAVCRPIPYTLGSLALSLLVNLLKLVGTLYAALVVFVLCVFLPLALIFRIPIARFLKAVAEPASIAFATASSEAALPRAMESMEAFGVPRQIVAFVMPTGYSFNLDGSTLYLSLACIFVAQAPPIPLSFSHPLTMVFPLMLPSNGLP